MSKEWKALKALDLRVRGRGEGRAGAAGTRPFARLEDLRREKSRPAARAGVWEASHIAFLKPADARPVLAARVCVPESIVHPKTSLKSRAWSMAFIFAVMTSCAWGAL